MLTEGAIARDAAKAWPRYFDWEGACEYLSESRDGLYRLVQQGLPAIRVGRGPHGKLKFDRLRLDAWLAERAISNGHGLNLRRAG